MRTVVPPNSPISFGTYCACVFAPLAVFAAALGGAQMLAAQTQAPVAPSVAAHKPAPQHKRPGSAHAKRPAAQAASAIQATAAPQAVGVLAKPPAPEVPVWPANEKPVEAQITWNSQGLRIEAANSSLQQILKDVSTATGAKVEGLDNDERVFGAFGPGQARDVLYTLLQGSGYNVLMIGDQGQGTPREIVLTSRHATNGAPAANPTQASDEDTDTDEQPQQPQPPIRPGFGPGGQRTPQQFNPEMQRQPHPQQVPANAQPQ
jgi:hypothetical protein